MSTRTRVFHRDELAAMGIPSRSTASGQETAERLHGEEIERHRWHSSNYLVFRAPDDGRIWRITYLEGLTEIQEDIDPWNYESEIEAEEVAPYLISHTSWMTEDEASFYPHQVTPIKTDDL